MKVALFADAGQLLDYVGPTSWDVTGETLKNSGNGNVRSSVGVGLIWDSPFGPLRFDLAYALTKDPFDPHADIPVRRRYEILEQISIASNHPWRHRRACPGDLEVSGTEQR